MRLHLNRIFGSILLAAGMLLPSGAFATDARAAIRLCEKNPNCNYNVNDSGTVDLFVGNNIILCPQKGECECVCNVERSGGPRFKPNLLGVLQGRT